MSKYLTIPCIKHISDEEVNEANLRLRNRACGTIKLWHHDWQVTFLLLFSLIRLKNKNSISFQSITIRIDSQTNMQNLKIAAVTKYNVSTVQ